MLTVSDGKLIRTTQVKHVGHVKAAEAIIRLNAKMGEVRRAIASLVAVEAQQIVHIRKAFGPSVVCQERQPVAEPTLVIDLQRIVVIVALRRDVSCPARKIRKRNIELRIGSYGKNFTGLIQSHACFKMSGIVSHVSNLKGLVRSQLILQGEIVFLRIGSLVIPLHLQTQDLVESLSIRSPAYQVPHWSKQ